MPVYWPWWAGGASLAIVAVGFCVVARRPLGVSGILGRFVNLREELAADRARALADAADGAAFEAALLAATAEAFETSGGVQSGCTQGAPPAAAPVPSEAHEDGCASTGLREACGGECASPRARPTLVAQAVFVGSIVAGGLFAQLARGAWEPVLDLGATFQRVVGTGARGALVLVIGGLLVGIGTTVSGGCSTGHGLSGCSRLQPAGVAATVSFMASAVLASFLLAGRLP